MMIGKIYKLFVIAIILIASSCSEMPVGDNPYDLHFDLPEAGNFEVQDISITCKQLSWDYELDHFEGFMISRCDDGAWQEEILLSPDMRIYLDENAAVNAEIQYRIRVKADENISDYIVSGELDNTIPAVDSLAIEQLDVSRFLLSWQQDQIIGEDGFAIERKIDNGVWEGIAVLDEDTEEFEDNLAVRRYDEVSYRIYCFVGEESSALQLIDASVLFPAPQAAEYEKLELDRIKITWQDESNGEEGFCIDRILDGISQEEYAVLPENTTEWIDENATINHELQYKVYAFAGENTSDHTMTTVIDNTFPQVIDLAVEQQTVQEFYLSWEQDQIVGERGFELERAFDEGEYNIIALLTPDTEEYTDNICQRDSVGTVHYKIRGYLNEDFSEYSSVECTIGIEPPGDLSYDMVTIDQIELNWTDNSNGEEGFCIDRKIGDNLWFNRYDTVEENITNWLDDDVPVDENISYRVRAYAGEYESDYLQTEVIDTTLPEVADLSIEPLDIHTFQINWQQDHIMEEEGLLLYRSINDNAFAMIAELMPDTETYTDDVCTRDMLNSVAYRICVDFGDHISGGVTDSLETEIPAPDYTGYGRIAVNQLSIHWIDNAEGEEGYIIDRSANISGYTAEIGTTGANAEEWLDEDVPVNEIITYRLRTFAGVYQSTYETGTAIHNDLPAPAGVNYEIISLNQIELTWSCNCFGISGYKIDKKVGNGAWIEEYGITDGETFSWIDDDAEVNEIISYRLYIYFEDEVSDFVLIEDIDTEIPAPTDLEYQKLNIHTIQLNWQDNSIGEDGYFIDKKVGQGNWVNAFSYTGENAESWTDDEAEINEDLQYRVYAVFNNEESDKIETEVIDNTFPAPYNLELEELGGYDIQLTWEYDAIGIEGFRIEKKESGEDWELYADDIDPDMREWGETYYNNCNYRIQAFFQNHDSNYSNEVTFSRWVNIPAGDFTSGQDDEIINIPYDYEIMKYEVTNIQYVEYLENALSEGDIWIEDDETFGQCVYGYYEGDEWNSAGDYIYYDLGMYFDNNCAQISYEGNNFMINVPQGFEYGEFDKHPVVWITWIGANAFAGYYGWRLPTEQEWEKAARGMTGYDYPWGDVISIDRANYLDSGDPWDNGTTPVGYYNGENGTTHSTSPYGCYDMCGNVYNWTESWSGNSKIMKGGAFLLDYDNDLLKTWQDTFTSLQSWNDDYGFRCVRDVE